jgi:hypothetical protein
LRRIISALHSRALWTLLLHLPGWCKSPALCKASHWFYGACDALSKITLAEQRSRALSVLANRTRGVSIVCHRLVKTLSRVCSAWQSWNRADSLPSGPHWNFGAAQSSSDGYNATRAFCTTRTGISASALLTWRHRRGWKQTKLPHHSDIVPIRKVFESPRTQSRHAGALTGSTCFVSADRAL